MLPVRVYDVLDVGLKTRWGREGRVCFMHSASVMVRVGVWWMPESMYFTQAEMWSC